MKQITIYIILILLFSCKEDDWRDNLNLGEIPLEIKKTHETLYKHQKENYIINNSSKTKEEAIVKYIQSMASHKNYSKYIFSKEEYIEIYLPNTIGYGTLLDTTYLDNYIEILLNRKEIAQDQLLSLVKDKKVTVERIEWSSSKPYRAIEGWKPKIFVTINKQPYTIDNIKQVVGHNGQFKVAIIAP